MKSVYATVALVVFAVGGCFAAPRGLPPMVMPEGVGVNIHFIGREDKQVDQIAKAGFKWIRMDFTWAYIEQKKGVYDFKAYDELVESLAQRKIRALFILDYSNPLYDNNKAPYTEAGRTAFSKFASTSAAHFKNKGVLWEIWNEPNIGFWQPQPNVSDYIKLAKAVYKEIKRVDPKSTVLGPALAGWDFNYMESACKLGLLEAVDAISLHAYGASKPEDASLYFAKINEIVKKYAIKGKTYTMVRGEWGYSTLQGGISLDKQGEYIARCFIGNMMNGVPLSIWYDWHNDGPDPKENEHNFGTVFLDFSEKPSYKAVRTLTTQLKGYAYTKRLYAASEDDYLALFKKGKNYKLAAWTTGEPHNIELPIDSNNEVNIVSIYGSASNSRVINGRIDLKLTGGVQYIEPKSSVKQWEAENSLDSDCTVEYRNGIVNVRISAKSSNIASVPEPMTVKANGLSKINIIAKKHRGRTEIVYTGRYVAGMQELPKAVASIMIKGLPQPILRSFSLSSSDIPKIILVPSVGKELIFKVSIPLSNNNGFTGTLSATMPGVDSLSAPVNMPESQHETFVRIKTNAVIPRDFNLSAVLKNGQGLDIATTPTQRYVIAETFADGVAGDLLSDYKAVPDGNFEIPAKATLAYDKSPADGPAPICAKLVFQTAAGWRFFRVSPNHPIPIVDQPKAVRIWTHGPSKEVVSRLRFNDAEQETFQPNYTGDSSDRWNVLEARLDGKTSESWGTKADKTIQYPIGWDSIFLADTMTKELKGDVYLGPVMLIY